MQISFCGIPGRSIAPELKIMAANFLCPSAVDLQGNGGNLMNFGQNCVIFGTNLIIGRQLLNLFHTVSILRRKSMAPYLIGRYSRPINASAFGLWNSMLCAGFVNNKVLLDW
jgi:hypothetical protein